MAGGEDEEGTGGCGEVSGMTLEMVAGAEDKGREVDEARLDFKSERLLRS